MQHYRQNGRITLVRLLAVILCCACVSFGASAVLSGFDMAGSGRGLALTLKADAPFTITTDQKVSAKNPGLSLLAIHCTGVIYGLEDFEFTSFPSACPLKRVSVSESPAGNSIDLQFAFTKSIDNPVAARQKGNKWFVLLSRAPADEFSWNASVQPKPVPAAQKQKAAQEQSGMSRLTDITLLHRDKVELLTFVFDGPTTMRLKRGQEKIVVLFVNATSGLSSTRFSPPGAPHTVIELKQVAHGGTMWLGAAVSMRKGALEGALMQAFSDKLVIYSPSDTLQCLSLWSAAQGQSMSYPFIKIPSFEVDYDSMKRKALTDLSGDMAPGKTFAVREEAPKKTGQAPPPAEVVRVAEKEAAAPQPVPAPAVKKEPAPVRLLVTKNNVNLRSEPVAGDNVTAKLPLGTAATQIEKKGAWVKIRTPEATGWVSSAMTVDSAKAPMAVLQAIDKFNQQRIAQQKAAEEKAARESAAREKAGQEKLAREKVALERAAQKKADLEAEAAQKKADREAQAAQKKAALAAQASVRDSTVRYAAAAQESVQTAKNIQAKKLVEYHVYARDPFLPLSRDDESPVPDVENLKIIGILYDEADRIALFEDNKNKAYALRENDPVQNGYLLRVQPDKVLFLINELGISRTYALKLTKEKEK
jgi:uncharacterized protein YgiM (DUF1202 family)